MTIKLRYKHPDGNKSQLIEKPVRAEKNLKNTSNNFRLATALAEFGMLLRDSEFKGEATYASAAKMAKSAKGQDENGYRKELVDMIETMGVLYIPENELEAGNLKVNEPCRLGIVQNLRG